MKRYGLIGFPLTHSFSQRFFSEKFQREGITDCVYQNFQLERIAELPGMLAAYPDLRGFNVTIPHKESVIGFLNSRSPVVEAIGACNCVRMVGDSLEGYNTDVTGFERSLKKFLDAQPTGALILGTGGSAKAVAFVLEKLGIPFSNVSRKPAAGQYSYSQLNASILSDYQLIINTTPLGMYPVDSSPPIPYESIGPRHYLFDLIYNPAKTIFLQKGEEKGAKIRNGHEMLVIQAEESWKIWNGESDQQQ